MDDSLKADLIALSREIHATPELAYQEHKAVAAIERVLKKYGHQMERPYGGLETAFGEQWRVDAARQRSERRLRLRGLGF